MARPWRLWLGPCGHHRSGGRPRWCGLIVLQGRHEEDVLEARAQAEEPSDGAQASAMPRHSPRRVAAGPLEVVEAAPDVLAHGGPQGCSTGGPNGGSVPQGRPATLTSEPHAAAYLYSCHAPYAR